MYCFLLGLHVRLMDCTVPKPLQRMAIGYKLLTDLYHMVFPIRLGSKTRMIAGMV